ncbi:hypothetical protein C8R43DRAFT_994763 [Mycena crocata]|nr:hypothetical protein C8R43DRAFT_994763 [Mycena crocata]
MDFPPPPPPGGPEPPGPPPLPGTLVADQRLVQALFLVGFVLVVYDYLVTFSAETRFIWGRPKRLSFYWFLLNRYLTLSTNIIMAVFTFATFSPEVCSSLLLAEKLFLFAQEIVVYGILTLRVYAMFNLNKRVLVLLCVAGLGCLGFSAWLVTTNTTPPPLPPPGPPPPGMFGDTAPNHDSGLPPPIAPPQCAQVIFHASAIRIAGAWEAQVALDTLIFGLTLLRAYLHRHRAEYRSSLLSCLIRDGAAYFFVIGIANLANILMYYFGDPLLAGSISWLASALSSVLIARLMLNLHSVADAGIYRSEIGMVAGAGMSEDVHNMSVWTVAPPPRDVQNSRSPEDVLRGMRSTVTGDRWRGHAWDAGTRVSARNSTSRSRDRWRAADE